MALRSSPDIKVVVHTGRPISEVRERYKGVSVSQIFEKGDEEMINIMTYQHAYSVASKLLTVADEMLQSLINFR